MSDELPIVRRLREIDTGDTPAWAVTDAAAFVICELVAALEPFARWCDNMEDGFPDLDDGIRVSDEITLGDCRRARAVLKATGGE
jgi:hypothetical protein